MNFAFPLQLYWFIALAILFILLLRRWRYNKGELTRLIDENVIEKIFPYRLWTGLSFKKFTLQLLGLFFLVLALAGPQIGKKLQEIQVSGSTVYILFDASTSMLVEDFKPNRMEKSKILLTGLLEKIKGSRVGIIAFAGEPYIFCPLTFDFFTLRQFLRSIEPGMIPQPGTEVGKAIRLALSKLPEDKSSGAIVLLTDGEDHNSDPIEAARQAKERGVKIFSIGIGDPEGQPIPIRDDQGNTTGYKKDKDGKIIVSKLDEKTLAQISLLTGGTYFRASSTEREVDLLSEKLLALDKDQVSKTQDAFENRYQWFLVIAFLFLLASELIETFSYKLFKYVTLLLLFLAGGSISVVHAETFIGKIREGNKLYEQEKYQEALQKYEEAQQLKPQDLKGTFNKGTAHYKLEEWEKAQEEFQKGSLSPDSKTRSRALYNLGNSQFSNGDYAKAIRSYQQSLKLDPNDPDTKFNLKLALQLKKNPPPKKKQSKDKNKKEKNEQQKSKAQQEKKEKEDNAKRILKGASEDSNNKPQFKPDQKGKKNKNAIEDW